MAKRILERVAELRDLHRRGGELARRINDVVRADADNLRRTCRARGPADMPELGRFESVFEQRDALRRAMSDPQIRLRTKCLRVFMAGGVAIGAFLLLDVGASLAIVPLLMLACGAATFGAQHWLLRPAIARALRRELVERGEPICIQCGYDLRGARGRRCPECGTFAEKLPPIAAPNGKENLPCPPTA